MFSFLYPSPLGLLFISSSNQGLLKLKFFNEKVDLKISQSSKIQNEYLNQAKMWLDLYFSKNFEDLFNLKFDFTTYSDFFVLIWNNLLKIQYGSTITYGELAVLSGKPKAAQAVGVAMKHNPLPVLIPCHRVVSSKGLGGYTPGLYIKKYLLNHEDIFYMHQINFNL